MAYEIPQNNVKRAFLLLKVKTKSSSFISQFKMKLLSLSAFADLHNIICSLQAAYNIGGHTVSADTIQSAILGCRTPRPGQVDHTIPTLPLKTVNKEERMSVLFVTCLKYPLNTQRIYSVNPFV